MTIKHTILETVKEIFRAYKNHKRSETFKTFDTWKCCCCVIKIKQNLNIGIDQRLPHLVDNRARLGFP